MSELNADAVFDRVWSSPPSPHSVRLCTPPAFPREPRAAPRRSAPVQHEEDAAQPGAQAPRRRRVDQVRLLDDVAFPLEEDEEEMFLAKLLGPPVPELHHTVLKTETRAVGFVPDQERLQGCVRPAPFELPNSKVH